MGLIYCSNERFCASNAASTLVISIPATIPFLRGM